MTTTTPSSGKRRRRGASTKAPRLSLPSELGASSDQATLLLTRCPTSDCKLCKKKLRICFLDVDSVMFMCTDEKCCFPIQSNDLREYIFPWVPIKEENVVDNTKNDIAMVGTTSSPSSSSASEQTSITSFSPTVQVPPTSIENLLGFDGTNNSFLVGDDSNLDIDVGTIDDTSFDFKLEDLETSSSNYPTTTSTTSTTSTTTTLNTGDKLVKKEQIETPKAAGGWSMGDEDDWPGIA